MTPTPLLKGKYVFFGTPQQQVGANLLMSHFAISALIISGEESLLKATTSLVDVTYLISKLSVYTDSRQSIEAHKLYTWPSKLGDPAAWAESKSLFFTQHLIHYPIEIVTQLDSDHVSWKYISPDDFKASASQAADNKAFQVLLENITLLSKLT